MKVKCAFCGDEYILNIRTIANHHGCFDPLDYGQLVENISKEANVKILAFTFIKDNTARTKGE